MSGTGPQRAAGPEPTPSGRKLFENHYIPDLQTHAENFIMGGDCDFGCVVPRTFSFCLKNMDLMHIVRGNFRYILMSNAQYALFDNFF